MSSRVAGAGLALIAAALLAVSVASPVVLPAQLSLFAGHPTVNDRVRDLQDVYVGLYDAQLCNTGGDGTCKSGDTKPAFHWLGYGALAATGVVTVSATVLALLTMKRSERRRTAALVVRLAGLVALATGGAMVWQGPFTSAQVPIGLGAAIYGASVVLAIVASLIAVRLPPPIKLRVAEREPAELLDTVRNASWVNRGPPAMVYQPAARPPAAARQPAMGHPQVSREPPPPAIDMEALFGDGEPSTHEIDHDPGYDPRALPELPAVSGELMQPEPAPRPGTEPRTASAVRRAMKDAAFQGPASGLVMQRPVIPRPIAPGEVGPPPPPLVPWPTDGSSSAPSASASWTGDDNPLLPPPPPPIAAAPAPIAAPAQGSPALPVAAVPPIAPPPRPARETQPPPTPPARAGRETQPPPRSASESQPAPPRAAGDSQLRSAAESQARAAGDSQPPQPRSAAESQARAAGDNQPPPPRMTRETHAAPPPPRPARTTLAPPATPAPRTPSDSQPPPTTRGLRAAVPMPERPASPTRPPPVTAAPPRIAPPSRIGKPTTLPPPFVIPPIPAIRPGVPAIPAAAPASGPAARPAPEPAPPRAASISDGTAARLSTEGGDTTSVSQGPYDKTADDSGPFDSGLIAPPGVPDTSPTGMPVRDHHVNGTTRSPVAPAAGAKLPISTAPQSLPPPKEDPTQLGPTPACPQCESPMTWVDEHLRFYCKSCRMYF